MALRCKINATEAKFSPLTPKFSPDRQTKDSNIATSSREQVLTEAKLLHTTNGFQILTETKSYNTLQSKLALSGTLSSSMPSLLLKVSTVNTIITRCLVLPFVIVPAVFLFVPQNLLSGYWLRAELHHVLL